MIAADPAKIVTCARSWLGTPYHDQASLKGVGADCLGLARGIWREVVGPEPRDVPAYTRDWGETVRREVLIEGAAPWMIPIDKVDAGAGSVVIFRMVREVIAKHIGILTGEGTFIHAYSGDAVREEPLTTAWSRRIAFACNFPKPAE